MTPSPWTPALIAKLARLWRAGMSAAEIGRRIGMSKNAIVGKARRLGLPPRENPVDYDKVREARIAAAEAAAKPRGIGCRWIESADYLARLKRGEEIFCGRPVAETSGSWCAAHRARVWAARGSAA